MANLDGSSETADLKPDGFEKKGGYESKPKAPLTLPTVDSGPAPGAQPKKPADSDGK